MQCKKTIEAKHGPLSKLTRAAKDKIPELWHYDPPKKKGQTDKEWMSYWVLHDGDPWRSLIHIGMARQWGLKQMVDPDKRASGENHFQKPNAKMLLYWTLDDLNNAFGLAQGRLAP